MTQDSGFALSARVRRVQLSPVAAASARAAELAAAGREIIALTAGEPDFDTPAPIKAAATAALERGDTKYTPTDGTRALRAAIRAKYARERGLDIALDRITVANGAKQVIYNAFAATLDAGDEVIVPAPYWPSFPDIVRVNDGTPVFVRCEREAGFKLDARTLEAAITARTRWLILNSPNNPTGAVYTQGELAALAAVLRRHPRVLVLWDEIYEHIWFDEAPPAHWLQVAPDLAERSLLVNGPSKTYAMTGWRIGWGAGPVPLVRAMTVMQSQESSGANAPGQAATAFALGSPDQDFVAQARAAYARRAASTYRALAAVPGLVPAAAHGAFFLYVGCAPLIGRVRPDGRPIASDDDLAEWLLDGAGVAVVAGSAYGLSPYFRVSIAASDAALAQAATRIAAAVQALRAATAPAEHA